MYADGSVLQDLPEMAGDFVVYWRWSAGVFKILSARICA
jgi:hypothetical protein